jgi:hypothetical protein
MSEKKQKPVTYNKISVEPGTRLGAPIDEVLERKKQMMAKFRSGK